MILLITLRPVSVDTDSFRVVWSLLTCFLLIIDFDERSFILMSKRNELQKARQRD